MYEQQTLSFFSPNKKLCDKIQAMYENIQKLLKNKQGTLTITTDDKLCFLFFTVVWTRCVETRNGLHDKRTRHIFTWKYILLHTIYFIGDLSEEKWESNIFIDLLILLFVASSA